MRGDRTAVYALRWILVTATATTGCAYLSEPLEPPTPEELPPLEVSVALDSTDVAAVAALSVGYAGQGRVTEALALLSGTRERLPDEPTLLAMAGLVEHELGLFESAVDRFSTYLARYGGPLHEELRPRLEAARGPALEAAAARLVAAGTPADSAPPAGPRVAVLPFAHAGAREDLAIGLAWLIERELSASTTSLVERRWVGALMDAMGVGVLERADLSVGLRLASMAGATHVVQGTLRDGDGDVADAEVVVLSVRSGDDIVASFLPGTSAADRLPELGARLATLTRLAISNDLFDVGVAAEASGGPAPDVGALTAFAQGLRAADEDDWSGALTAFEAARAAEPDFRDAADWVLRATEVLRTESEPLAAELLTVARVGEEQRAVASVRGGFGSSHRAALSRVGSRDRDAISEVLGVDGVGSGAPVTLILQPSTVDGGSP